MFENVNGGGWGVVGWGALEWVGVGVGWVVLLYVTACADEGGGWAVMMAVV